MTMVPTAAAPSPALAGRPLPYVEVLCPTCGEVLRHRILRTRSPDRDAEGGRPPRAVQGVARCSRCGGVHPFRLNLPGVTRVRVILSEGRSSESFQIPWDPSREVMVGSRLTLRGRPVKVLRVEDQEGRSLSRSRADRLRAVWAVPWERVRVPVSVPEGHKTRVLIWETVPGRAITIGEEFSLSGEPLRVVGFHGQGHKEDRPGRSLPAEEIKRVYARSGGRGTPERTAPVYPRRVSPSPGPRARARKPPGGRSA